MAEIPKLKPPVATWFHFQPYPSGRFRRTKIDGDQIEAAGNGPRLDGEHVPQWIIGGIPAGENGRPRRIQRRGSKEAEEFFIDRPDTMIRRKGRSS